MKIRSLTFFTHPGQPTHLSQWPLAARCRDEATQALRQAGYEVQTSRLATVPFSQLAPDPQENSLVNLALNLEAAAARHGFDYLSLGPATPQRLDDYSLLPAVLAATRNVFLSGHLTAAGQVSLPAVRACAEVIERSAALAPDGFTNLRFAALANVPPGVPFFPAAYHQGDQPAIAVAVECADLAVEAFRSASSLESARRQLIASIEAHAGRISALVGSLAVATGLTYHGIDFSLAPFPTDVQSLGAAFERLGLPAIGLHGSLAAAAFIADSIDRAQFQRTGFSGLMMPVLEDSVLARRAGDGSLAVMDLLLYSAVCGVGLDTIPLPGDTTAGELYAVLLDVAAMALRLGKPLTARLMPVPGKAAGDPTGYDFAFFANSRVMALRAAPLGGLLAGDEALDLRPRPWAWIDAPKGFENSAGA